MLFWRSASSPGCFNLEPEELCPVQLGSEAKFPLVGTTEVDSNCRAHSVKQSVVPGATWLLGQADFHLSSLEHGQGRHFSLNTEQCCKCVWCKQVTVTLQVHLVLLLPPRGQVRSVYVLKSSLEQHSWKVCPHRSTSSLDQSSSVVF